MPYSNALVIFVYLTLYLDSEYALCAPLFILVEPSFPHSGLILLQVALMTETWIHREFGYFKKRWVAAEDDSMNYPYRPVSYLRLAVAGFRNFGLKGVPKSPPPFVRVTLLPEGDHSGKIPTSIQEYHIATFVTSPDRHGSLPSLICPSDLHHTGGMTLRDNIESSRNQKTPSSSGGLGQFISSLSLSRSICHSPLVVSPSPHV